MTECVFPPEILLLCLVDYESMSVAACVLFSLAQVFNRKATSNRFIYCLLNRVFILS